MRMSHYLYQAPAKPAATQHGAEDHGGASNSGLWRGRDSRGILLPSISQGERTESERRVLSELIVDAEKYKIKVKLIQKLHQKKSYNL